MIRRDLNKNRYNNQFCAANTTIKTAISLKITLDESDWIFQTRREKILEARNKEIRLKEKTKVTTKLFPIKILQWGLCPRIFFYVCLFFSGNAWSWRTWGKKDWRSHNVMFWKLVLILLCRQLIFGQKQSVLPVVGALPSPLIFLAATKCYFCFISEFVEEDIWEGLCNFWIFKKICDVDDDLIWQRQNEKLTSGKRLVLSILDTLSILNILSISSILTAGMAGALDMFRKKGGGEADQVRIST